MRRRGGTRWSMQRTPPLLLTMEDTAYSPYPPYDGGDSLFHLTLPSVLHHEQDVVEYDVYSIVSMRGEVGGILLLTSSPPRDGVRIILFIFVMEDSGSLLHCGEETRSTPPLLLVMEETAYSWSSIRPPSWAGCQGI